MSGTNDRISQEQFGQTLAVLTDANFAGGKYRCSEYLTAIICSVTDAASFELNLAPAGESEGRICSLNLSAGADATLVTKGDGVTLFTTNDASVSAVAFCDGRSWRVIWLQSFFTSLEETLAALTARHEIPDGGADETVLAKASADDGDVEWVAIPKIPAGGTTGQVLSKKSGDDFDLEWTTP